MRGSRSTRMSFYCKNDEAFLIDKDNSLSGIYYENYVATELVARRMNLFYWKGKRDSELEFIIDINQNIIPIDVKKENQN